MLDGVRRAGSIDIEAEHGDAEIARVIEDESPGIHARIMGEDTGEKGCRMVGLKPRRLIGGQGESSRVGLAETKGSKSPQHLPDTLDSDEVVAVREGRGIKPCAHVVLPLGRAHGAARLISLGEGTAGHLSDDAQHLLVEDDHAVGLGKDRTQVIVDIDGVIPALAGTQEGRDHVGLHRSGPEERDIDDDVVEILRCELADELTLSG